MREMATDRPDVTESAYTLDAGHFQIETDLHKTIRNKQGGLTSMENYYNLANVKLGLTNSTDFQVVLNSYQEIGAKSLGAKSFEGSFFNDVTLRIKQNLWGNKGGKTALSILPFVNLPSKEDSRADGGVIFPLAVELSDKWNFGAQAEFDLTKNEDNKKYHGEILNSFTVNRELSKKLEGFLESFYTYSFGDKSFELYGDAGLIFSLSDNFKLDTGLNYGLTKGSDKVYFVGLSFRY
ncbi:MAG: transporter [Sphingobacteriaceae bacterium]|jgi:hypothetical protein|nr:transporter [Sphingobacteriaceae bacterium]